MSERFVQAIWADDIAPGGMKAVELHGREIVLCNRGGTFHAIARRCGHMNAPLEKGTLDGAIVTCAMHCAQFDAITLRHRARDLTQDGVDDVLDVALIEMRVLRGNMLDKL